VREPMKTIRRVGSEFFERFHFADFGRNPDKAASVKNEMLDSLQFRNARREDGNLSPFFWLHFRARRKLFPSVASTGINQLIQTLPTRTLKVLLLGMNLKF